MVMFDKKTILRNFDRAAKEEAKRIRKAALEFNIEPFDVQSWSERAMNNIPEVAKAVGKKEHKRLYRIASSMCDIGVYQPKAIYFGCWLVEYKWSWKLNKAVRL